jgi:DNA-directed RNA polymerase, subunit M (EC 2.7.7.6)
MEFCPKCGTVMFPQDDKFQCKCGYEKKNNQGSNQSIQRFRGSQSQREYYIH